MVDKNQSPGEYTVFCNGTDQEGLSLPAGIYFVSLECQGCSERRKMAFIR
ncbi:hypothetical protein JW935_03605 [candidate division KSB1 bacterium]|nr:hypothetical protein [candidate division KSB1 bacterium]